MKRYTSSTTKYLNGSYLVDRGGNLYDVTMHVPSTTFLDRGLHLLAPIDAGFLFDIREFDEDEVLVVLQYWLAKYLKTELHETNVFKPSMLDLTSFMSWAELKYSSSAHSIFTSHMKEFYGRLSDDDRVDFYRLNDEYYTWLKDNFVKLSVTGRIVEFRIQSEDNFDWNEVIIDDVILSYDWKPNSRFNILREDSDGYKAFFFNATLDNILEDDDTILATVDIMKKQNKIADSFKTRDEVLAAYEKIY